MVRDKKNSLLTKLKNEAVESRVKNFLLPFELAHFRVTRYIQGNGIHRKGRREGEEEGQRTARN